MRCEEAGKSTPQQLSKFRTAFSYYPAFMHILTQWRQRVKFIPHSFKYSNSIFDEKYFKQKVHGERRRQPYY